MIIYDLFKSFFIVGATGYGGGSALAPLIHREAVEKHDWVTEEEFIDIVAIANMLPGASMVEMASAVGYKMAGVTGAVVASFAITLPIMLVFTFFMVVLNQVIPTELLNTMTAPVLGTVSALMLTLTKKLYIQSNKQINAGFIILISLISMCLIYFLKIHPSLVISGMIILVFISSIGGKK